MKNKRGFTLIELLAVIVILAIIALIAVPVIMNIINKANKSAFKDTAYGVISAGELYFAERQLEPDGMAEDEVTFDFSGDLGDLEIKGSLPTSGILKVNKEGKTALAISNGRFCAAKGYNDSDVLLSDDLDNCVIPVKITDFTISLNNAEIPVGFDEKVNVTVQPKEATHTSFTWTVGNTSIATVDANGVITGVSSGTTTVTATTIDGSKISKSLNITVVPSYTNGIMTSTNNCILDGNTCPESTIKSDAGIKVKVNVSDTESRYFYVIADKDSKLTLVMNENLDTPTEWISGADYTTENNKDANPDTCASTACIDEGPVTALNTLKKGTSTWDNITEVEYTTKDDNTTARYTEVKTLTHARMMTYTEATSLGCVSGSRSCPDYLFEKLSQNTNSHFGIWLSTAYTSDTKYAWYIRFIGDVYRSSDISLIGMTSPKALYIGVRPVIEIAK